MPGILSNNTFLFGIEVDPSNKGHDGTGSFESDLIFISDDGQHDLERATSKNYNCPELRGESNGSMSISSNVGCCVFGGLSADDDKPKRLE